MGRKGRKHTPKHLDGADDAHHQEDPVDDEHIVDDAGEPQEHDDHAVDGAAVDPVSTHVEHTPDVEQQPVDTIASGGEANEANDTTSPHPSRVCPDEDLEEADATANSTLEGTDGGDTREGSAGNPYFSNATTEDLPLASPHRELQPPQPSSAEYQEITVGSANADNSNNNPELTLSNNLMSPMTDDLQAQSTRVVDFDDAAVDGDGAHNASVVVDPQSWEEQEGNDAGGDANPSHQPIDCADVPDAPPQHVQGEGRPADNATLEGEAANGEEQQQPRGGAEAESTIAGPDDGATVSADWATQKLLSLRNYVDARCDRIHVALLETEQRAKECTDSNHHAMEAASAATQQELRQTAADLEAKFAALNQVTSEETNRAVADAYDSLAGAVRDADSRLQDGYQQAVSRIETELTFLVNQLSDRVAQLSDNAAELSTSVGNDIGALRSEVAALDAKLSRALTMELLPPAAPLPTEGTRLRLVIAVDCPQSNAASTTVLLPVSDAATVGMLKREVLRRAVQQSIVPTAMHTYFVFSKTVVILDGIALFEEDTLSDVGIQANDKLVIRSTETIAVAVGQTTPQQGVGHDAASTPSASMPTPPAVATAPVGIAAHQVHPSSSSLQSEPSSSSAAAIPAEAAVSLETVFLNADAVANLDDQESMDRRLTAELARMEIDPLKREEQLRRVAILKAAADKVRITLLDRATYSHDDYERRVARGALEKLNDALAAGTTPNGIVEATLAGRNALVALRSNAGEDDRVQALEQAAATERNRKERTLEDLKDLIFTLRHRLRIPADLYGAAEHLLFAADRAILLAPSTTVKELDAIHKEFADFVDKLRSS